MERPASPYFESPEDARARVERLKIATHDDIRTALEKFVNMPAHPTLPPWQFHPDDQDAYVECCATWARMFAARVNFAQQALWLAYGAPLGEK